MRCMVAIGSHGQPSVVELQAKAIRATCGPVPILVSDDKTEEATNEELGAEYGAALKAKLLAVCDREGLIYRDTAPGRVGHAGGDLGALFHGLTFAAVHGIDVLVKLSQRFVLDIPDWIHLTAKAMRQTGAATCSRHCFYGRSTRFHLRTEFLALDVARWARPDVLHALTPRPLGFAAEDLIDRCRQAVDGGAFLASPLFGEDRHADYPGIAWHDVLPEEVPVARYAAMFAKYGVTPGPEFSVAHSCTLPGHRGG